MDSLILTAFVLIVALFHLTMNHNMRKGNVKTAFCAVWCIDAIFAICGTVISFVLYRYVFAPFLTVRNMVLIIVYLLITVVFIWVTPSSFALILGDRNLSEEALLTAEYRLNDTLGIVRNCFLILLFCLPIFFAVVCGNHRLSLLVSWDEAEVCGGFCFVAFLILIPICLRQAIFWLRNLTDAGTEAEQMMLKKYSISLRYRQKNRML